MISKQLAVLGPKGAEEDDDAAYEGNNKSKKGYYIAVAKTIAN